MHDPEQYRDAAADVGRSLWANKHFRLLLAFIGCVAVLGIIGVMSGR